MSRLAKAVLIAASALSLAVPCRAASSTSSAISDSFATSVGSVSTSFQKSSDSSSRKDVAQGDYRIVDMAAAADRPGQVRLQLQAVADASADGAVVLYLPQAASEQGRLAPGHVITARQRGYGLEFSKADTREAFFLVLADDVYRELQTNKVVAL